MRWVLVEASDRILPEVSDNLGRYTATQLRRRSIEVLLGTRLRSCVDGHVMLTNGQQLDADTIVWTAGVRANPILFHTDLPLDADGRIVTDTTLAVDGDDGAWAAGDCAAVADLTAPGQLCAPSAQHAVRQAKVLADNVMRTMRHRPLRAYRHHHAGSVASLGLHKGVAEVYGVRLRGLPAWFMHRTYHLVKMPTANRKVRIAIDWTLALCFRRDVISLGQLQQPRKEFERAAVRSPVPQAQP